MAFPQRPHTKTATDCTGMDVVPLGFIEHLIHGKPGQQGNKTLVPLYTEDDSKVLFPAAVIQKTIITDFLEPRREHMHHETPDELPAGKSHLHGCRVIFVVFCGKGDRIRRDCLYPGIGDGDTVRIPSQVFDGIAKAIEGLPDIRTPGGVVKGVPES